MLKKVLSVALGPLAAACIMLGLYGMVKSVPAIAQAVGYTLGNGTTVQGHLLTAAPSLNGAAPSIPTVAGASCGTPVLTANSTDFSGEFQAKGTSTCKLTFGTVFATRPFCVVSDNTTPASSANTVSTTGITMGTTVSNDLITYVCVGQPGN